MKRLAIIAILVLSPSIAWGQNFSDILSQIEQNNPVLKALQAEASARAQEARTGLAPADPEIEAGYLWGKPSDTGNRVDLSVTQTFDFPTAYYWRRKVSDGNVDLAQLEYLAQRREVMLEAETLCIEMVFRNALQSLLSKRLEMARTIESAMSQKAALGDASHLDLNKAELNLLSARRSADENEVERDAVRSQLARLNGGVPISLDADCFMPAELPSDFETWYSDVVSPEIRTLERREEVSQLGVKVEQAGWLPKFSVGYVSERIAGTVLQGVGVGVSIPLWENHGKVKAAKAVAEAAKSRLETERLQFECSMKTLYDRAVKLVALVKSYRESVEAADSMELLQKALSSGQLSLIDFIVEQEVWYDSAEEILASERDLQVLCAELRSFESR